MALRFLLLVFCILCTGKAIEGGGVYQSLGVQSVFSHTKVDSHRHRVRRESPTLEDREKCSRQTHTPTPLEVDTTSRLQKLRDLMRTKNLAAYIIPMSDDHQSEYVAEYDKRVKFISGVSGSAGLAVVTMDKAALWTDGRYFLQAEDQLDCNWIFMKYGESGVPSTTDWLIEVLNSGQSVGGDPRTFSYDSWSSREETLGYEGITLKFGEELVDQAWDELGEPYRPARLQNDLLILDIEFAGESWQDKVGRVREHMEGNAEAAVFDYLDENAWLFNLRGSDVPYNPVFLSYSIVEMDKVTLYLYNHAERLDSALQSHLNTRSDGTCANNNNCVNVKPYSDFIQDIRDVSGKVWVSPMSSYYITGTLQQSLSEAQARDKVYRQPSVVRALKGRKNPVEIEGLRQCHIRDSVAVIEFLTELEKEVQEGKHWTEISAADRLEEYRRDLEYNKGLSFATISAFGSNGAVIHYIPSDVTDTTITTDGMYLLDSGGQYLDGTTDVTRTLHFGNPTAFEKEAYTYVLMGAIDLARAIWPNGTYGRDIEVLARQPLWAVGLDYRHGTGHGIGAFLNVHEGPGRINKGYRATAYESPLYGEMFFSDEPGYYEDDSFGVRLETIVMTKKVDTTHQFGDGDYIGFETFTLVPFEPKLIKYELLNPAQRTWLNEYHKKCLEVIGEKVLKAENKMAAYQWLVDRTQPIPVDVTYSSAHGQSTTVLGILGMTVICILMAT